MSEVRAYACRLLARREYSVGEIRRKLESKWPGSEELDAEVDFLVEEGLVSDARFAEGFVRSRVARWQGPRKIRAELMRRSVPEAEIDTALGASARDWTDLASEWLSRQAADLGDYGARAKYYRRLVNRGFTHDQAMDALNDQGSGSEGV